MQPTIGAGLRDHTRRSSHSLFRHNKLYNRFPVRLRGTSHALALACGGAAAFGMRLRPDLGRRRPGGSAPPARKGRKTLSDPRRRLRGGGRRAGAKGVAAVDHLALQVRGEDARRAQLLGRRRHDVLVEHHKVGPLARRDGPKLQGKRSSIAGCRYSWISLPTVHANCIANASVPMLRRRRQTPHRA